MIQRRKNLPDLLDRFQLKKGAEIGVAGGYYSSEILKGSKAVEQLLAIDAWAGDRGHNDAQFQQACECLDQFGKRVKIWRSDFSGAAATIPAESLDFVYVDGYAHTGNNSGENFEMFWGAVRKGGLFGGHDYCSDFPANIQAVDDFVARHQAELEGFWITDKDVFRSWFVWKKPQPAGMSSK